MLQSNPKPLPFEPHLTRRLSRGERLAMVAVYMVEFAIGCGALLVFRAWLVRG